MCFQRPRVQLPLPRHYVTRKTPKAGSPLFDRICHRQLSVLYLLRRHHIDKR
jgi:hypothetical protein